jgi:probable HAF family extracellular repeat protein
MKSKLTELLAINCLLLLFSFPLPANEGHAQYLSGPERGPMEYCVLPVGDLNGDGTEDHAISREGISPGTAVTYLFLSGKEMLPESFDDAYLMQNANYVLSGPAAAPFACTPIKTLSVSASKVMNAGEGRFSEIPEPGSPTAVSPLGQPTLYTMIDLNVMIPRNYSMARGINAAGQVVGEVLTASGLHAFVYDGVVLRDLGTLGGHLSEARAINSTGDIVGYSLTGEVDQLGFVASAFLSDGFSMWSLGMPWSHAFGINDKGQIVGDMQTASGRYHAFLYEDGDVQDLGTLDGMESFAYSLNEAGHVVGEADTFIPGTPFPSIRGFVYKDGTMDDLGSLGYYCRPVDDEDDVEDCYERSAATDINAKGQIVGFSTTESRGDTHAFLITNGIMTDLGTLGGRQSWAQAVNASGQVVGSSLISNDAAYHAFLFDEGTMYDLAELVTNRPSSFSMWEASDINNFGQIVGVSYLLNPVYPSIAHGQEFSFSDSFGQELTFEYWIDTRDTGRCIDQRAFARIEVKIEDISPDHSDQVRLHKYLGRWLPAVQIVQGCASSKDWRKGSIVLPVSMQNRIVTIKVRLREFGSLKNSTVYLRHIRMK